MNSSEQPIAMLQQQQQQQQQVYPSPMGIPQTTIMAPHHQAMMVAPPAYEPPNPQTLGQAQHQGQAHPRQDNPAMEDEHLYTELIK